MKSPNDNPCKHFGGIGRTLPVVVAVLATVFAWLYLDEEGDGTDGSAVDLIKRPIEVRRVTDNVFYATGVANTVMVTTSAGNVVFDTGLVIQAAKQLRWLKSRLADTEQRLGIVAQNETAVLCGQYYFSHVLAALHKRVSLTHLS